MRQPSGDSAYDWWRTALREGVAAAGVHEDEPHPGLYKRRVAPRGPFVPARIFWVGEVAPETGELLSDERLACEIHGSPADPYEQWLWLAKHPITTDEYDDLIVIARGLTI